MHIFLLFFVLFLPLFSHAQQAVIEVMPHSDGERMEVPLNFYSDIKPFIIENPLRLVVDLPKNQPDYSAAIVRKTRESAAGRIRHGWQEGGKQRLVLDLVKNVHIKASFVEKRGAAHRLIIDFAHGQPIGKKEVIATAPAPIVTSKQREQVLVAPTPPPLPLPKSEEKRNFPKSSHKPLIVIDAGHGGEDPGAIGRTHKTKEKDITLKYAKNLRDELLKTGRYNVRMTRDDDRFLKLRQRREIARKLGANLFISLHADSAPNKNARGFSVYTLSEQASDKEAAALAARENKADLIVGVDLKGASPDVADILIDLAQRETNNRSSHFAEILVATMKDYVILLQNTHRYAGFAVLRSPDVPSVLIELGFLSNKQDEELLRSSDHMRKTIRGTIRGIDRFFDLYPL